MIFTRQLGFDHGVPMKESHYGNVGADFAMDQVDCDSTADFLQNCSYITNDNCGAGEGAGVQCYHVPIITKVEIATNIMYRYAQTVVKSTMKNVLNTPQEVTFNMTLPEVAVISNFTITSDGEEHVAEVLGREEA